MRQISTILLLGVGVLVLSFSLADEHEKEDINTLTTLIKDGNTELRRSMKNLKKTVKSMMGDISALKAEVNYLRKELPRREQEKIRYNPDMPRRKTWWALRINDDFFTAGRVSDRMIKYAYENGFKSIVSVDNFTAPLQKGDEYFPTTLDAQIVAKKLGIPYGIARPVDWNEWRDIQIVHQITEHIDRFPRPTLVHCTIGLSSTFFLLNYFANKTRLDPTFQPHVTANNFFDIGASFGYEYATDDKLKEIISETTGTDVSAMMAKTDIPTGRAWLKYWQAKHVHKNIFVAGQIWSSTLQDIKNAGYTTIFNFRKGVKENSMPSQGEVTLLNVQDKTGTYVLGGRQSKKRLEETRIDASKPNEYISSTSMVNYESMNALEFGDSVGYNETIEKLAVEAPEIGIKYYNNPDATVIKQAIQNSTGLVLFHSQTGHKALKMALDAIMEIWGLPQAWASRRAYQLGYTMMSMPYDE